MATSNRRFTLWLLGGVTAFVVAAALVVVFVVRSPEGRRVTLPETFAGYQRLHNTAAADLQERLEGALPVPGLGKAIFGHATVGAYGHDTGDQPALVVVTLPRQSIEALGAGDDNATVHLLLDAAVTDGSAYPAGRRGGALRCGTADTGSGGGSSACAWSDASTAGIAIIGYPDRTPAQAAGIVNVLRAGLR